MRLKRNDLRKVVFGIAFIFLSFSLEFKGWQPTFICLLWNCGCPSSNLSAYFAAYPINKAVATEYC